MKKTLFTKQTLTLITYNSKAKSNLSFFINNISYTFFDLTQNSKDPNPNPNLDPDGYQQTNLEPDRLCWSTTLDNWYNRFLGRY